MTGAGVDSQALTYFIQGTTPGYEPIADPLARQRVAMVRIFMYAANLLVVPTVEEEFHAIKRPGLRDIHQTFCDAVLVPVSVNGEQVGIRVEDLSKYHSGQNDCQILAEAESAQIPTLLTNDDDLIKHLSPVSQVKLIRPMDYWNSLRMGPEAEVRVMPAASNPLSSVDWWKIGRDP